MKHIDVALIIVVGMIVALSAMWEDGTVEVAQGECEKTVFPAIVNQDKFVSDEVPPKMSVCMKKERFYYLVVPAVQKVHKAWEQRYYRIAKDLNNSVQNGEIEVLKNRYSAQSNEELLSSLKPHPPSITIAQAAMESAWATSRFFVKANNIFGVWSVGDSKPRIAAAKQRDGKRTIWLRKYDSIEEAVWEYYDMLARVGAYEEFRYARLQSDDPFEIVEHLDRYSELGDVYTQELASLIRYNKLTHFDEALSFSNNP